MTDKLYDGAVAFRKLEDIRYKFILGRKAQLTELYITFDLTHFHHLAGLHKLTDIWIATVSRKFIVQDILDNKITYNKIATSNYISSIDDRINLLADFENIIDNNELVFRYGKLNKCSSIDAKYLLSTPYFGNEVYIFLSCVKGKDYSCRSFFLKGSKDYTERLPKYTLLYKEKIDMTIGTSVVQLNKLKKP